MDKKLEELKKEVYREDFGKAVIIKGSVTTIRESGHMKVFKIALKSFLSCEFYITDMGWQKLTEYAFEVADHAEELYKEKYKEGEE